MNNIEALLERLKSLQITKEASSDYKQIDTDITNKILTGCNT